MRRGEGGESVLEHPLTETEDDQTSPVHSFVVGSGGVEPPPLLQEHSHIHERPRVQEGHPAGHMLKKHHTVEIGPSAAFNTALKDPPAPAPAPAPAAPETTAAPPAPAPTPLVGQVPQVISLPLPGAAPAPAQVVQVIPANTASGVPNVVIVDSSKVLNSTAAAAPPAAAAPEEGSSSSKTLWILLSSLGIVVLGGLVSVAGYVEYRRRTGWSLRRGGQDSAGQAGRSYKKSLLAARNERASESEADKSAADDAVGETGGASQGAAGSYKAARAKAQEDSSTATDKTQPPSATVPDAAAPSVASSGDAGGTGGGSPVGGYRARREASRGRSGSEAAN